MKNRNFSINIIFTLLFLIISALFLIYIFRDINCREYFEGDPYSWKYGEGNNCGVKQYNTNSELMNINSDFRKENYNRYEKNEIYNKTNLQNPNHPYRDYCDVMTWNDLLAYRCLKTSPLILENFLNNNNQNIKNTYATIYIYDELSLYSYLRSKIFDFYNVLNSKIIGPVYVCISQAPYLKYINKNSNNNAIDKTLDARIDILNNRNPFYLENINEDGNQNIITSTSYIDKASRDSSIISSLYCQIIIIYPLYNKNNRLKTTDKEEQKRIINNFLDTKMAPYYTDNKLCYIKCNKSSDINCGCLSYNNEDALQNTYFNEKNGVNQNLDLPKYTARCIDHTINSNMNDNFSMMYFVNPYANNYMNDKIIEDPDNI
jgi:hypothetical protein